MGADAGDGRVLSACGGRRLWRGPPHQLSAQYWVGVSGAHLAESLGGGGTLYVHWRYGAAVVWRLYVALDRIRAPALSLLQDGVSTGGVSLEFRGQELGVISPVNK